MMKKLLIAALALVLVAFGVVLYFQKATAPETPYVGVVSPYSQVPEINLGGMRLVGVKKDFTPATTTPCSIQAPSATSTLLFAGFQITGSTSTAATIDLATSTTRYATSTNLVAAKSIAANAQGYASWSSYGGNDDKTMKANEWVVVKTAGVGVGGYTYTGQCSALFLVKP
jgi:hypothetical protein